MRLKTLLGTGAAITLILCGVFLWVRSTKDETQIALIQPNPESTSVPPLIEKPSEPLVISTGTDKAIINWESWSNDDEPFHIKAHSDDAVIIFRFKQPPKDPKNINVTSNAAVYAETEDGLVPLTEKARLNSMLLAPSPISLESISIEGPAPVLRDR